MKRAGQTSGSLASTGRWRSQVAARKVAHAQDRRSSQTSFPGLSQRQIAASCAVGQATVSEYLKTAEAAGLRWPDIAKWSEDQVTQAVAPSQEKPGHRNQSPEPDYGDIRHELQTNKHVTLKLLWEEYREKNPDGYRYSRFCDLYRRWLRRQEVVLRGASGGREVVCRLRRRHHSHL